MGKFSYFFIDRPVFASVLSIVIVLVGLLSLFALPLTQYPPIAPPTIVVSTLFPGADAETVMDTVATPLEQEINGVEHMLYLSSTSSDTGSMNLTVTFEPGTDVDMAQVLVQNRVALASAKLPEEVRRQGISVKKSSPDLSLVINLTSPDGRYDSDYLSNYALTQIRDHLARQPGVGEVVIFGARDYSMRLWLNPAKLAELGLSPIDVVRVVREQNVEVAAGVVGKPPLAGTVDFQYTLTTQGRLKTPEQFADIVIKEGSSGILRLKDVARIELGARDYGSKLYLDGKPSVGLAIFQLPGSNAIETKKRVLAQLEKLKADFPPGLAYTLGYDTVVFVEESLKAVGRTLLEAVLLVALVVVVFLQNLRASLIPLLAVPVSVIGTFAVMAQFGASLNTLSLLSLVLAIGTVVDDAIVVVENVDRHLALGEEIRQATRRAMDEVTGPIIATSLVLIAVFLPTAFIAGVSQAFYREFALTVTASTVISTFNSLTLSPALCALLLGKGALPPRAHFFTGVFVLFNRAFSALQTSYLLFLKRFLRLPLVLLVLYLSLSSLNLALFQAVPKGFLPDQDQGYLVLIARLPAGASLERTDAVVQKVTQIALATEGVDHLVAYAGWSFLAGAQQPYLATMFARLKPFSERAELPAFVIAQALRRNLSQIQEAEIAVFPPPPVRGMSRVGGFKLEIQDKAGLGVKALESAVNELIAAANREAGLIGVFSTFDPKVPKLSLDIDRMRAKAQGVPLTELFSTLQIYLGSLYVNDLNLFGRTYQVIAQADAPFRMRPEKVLELKIKSKNGAMVPLASLASVRQTQGPDILTRYNLYLAAEVSGATLPGTSSKEALAKMERLAKTVLPKGFGFEWTELSLQEVLASNTALWVFPLSVVFVFLVLAAQYESWSLPLSVILIAPLSLTTAWFSLWLGGYENDILSQIGVILLVGLMAKNAILIVEFAKAQDSQDPLACALEAARIRLRPILMTSFTFILGVVPLAFAQGPGAEARRILGVTVFGGMLGGVLFILTLTPGFYVLVRAGVEVFTRNSQKGES
jgi:multidrug efflux pump